MSDPTGKPSTSLDGPAGPSDTAGARAGEDPFMSELETAARRMRAPWAAGIAGLLFAACFTGALVLLRSQPLLTATDAGMAPLFGSGQETPALVGGLYLAPLAGIMFLWFMAVVRDRLGELEDRFFATVFLGSGVLFVGLFFIAAALSSTLLVSVRELGNDYPTSADVELLRALAYTVMFGFATRAAAVFLLATASLGRRTGVLPRWMVLLGYLLGVVLLVVVACFDWIVLVVPDMGRAGEPVHPPSGVAPTDGRGAREPIRGRLKTATCSRAAPR